MAYNLVGIDGNAYSIMGYVSKCMRREHYSQKDIHDYITRATSSDYDNLLRVSIDMIDKLNEGKPQDQEDDE